MQRSFIRRPSRVCSVASMRNDPLAGDLVELLELFDNDFDAARASLSRMLAPTRPMAGRRNAGLASRIFEPQPHRTPNKVASWLLPPRSAPALAPYTRRYSRKLSRVFRLSQRDELAACVTYSSAMLGLPWHALPDSLDGWLFVTDLVTTKSGSPRKQIGQAQGFIDRTPTSQSMKLRLRAVIDSLVDSGAIERFAVIRRLPRQDLDAEQCPAAADGRNRARVVSHGADRPLSARPGHGLHGADVRGAARVG